MGKYAIIFSMWMQADFWGKRIVFGFSCDTIFIEISCFRWSRHITFVDFLMVFYHMKRFFVQGLCVFSMFVWSVLAQATIVDIQTNMGDIQIELYDTTAPKTVVNFLTYVNSHAYDTSFVHRSAKLPDGTPFVIQGGGYTWNDKAGAAVIPTRPPVVNEFGASNLRGTVAMAKLGGNPNSATDQWFINLGNNAANLDSQNGGFTVFGKIIGNGLTVADSIAALTVVNACPVFNQSCDFATLPVIKANVGYTSKTLVMVNSMRALKVQSLASASTVYTPAAVCALNGVMLTNPQSIPVTVTLLKNKQTFLTVTVNANSNLNVPLPSGLPIKKTDYLAATLPANADFSKPLTLEYNISY